MTYLIAAGIQISIDGSTWYKITDHNRQPVDVVPELIEASNRMANGKLRKYIISKKDKISTNWSYLPTKTTETVDGNYGPAWLESFYNANVGIPLYLKVPSSEIDPAPAVGGIPVEFNFKSATTGYKVYSVFITSFSKKIIHRTTKCDYVDMSIEFTEI